MNKSVFISICIPAYKQIEYLKRLLDSIVLQRFKDFEVIITDDSSDSSVEKLLTAYAPLMPLVYHKNASALGSPENWNAGIRLAKGQWIKIMHDDDWFSNETSLGEFASAAKENAGIDFIFSGFSNVDIKKGSCKDFVISYYHRMLLQKNPLTLFKQNFIGHPSTTLVKNGPDYWFDKKIKWVVDIEFYIRYLSKHKQFYAIKKPLIKIGINEYQITKEAFRNPAIEIPEVLYLYHKLPETSLRNVFVYDYYWRFLRNLSIRKAEDLKRFAPELTIPEAILKMITIQSKWPVYILKIGLLSKSLMLQSYIRYRYRSNG